MVRDPDVPDDDAAVVSEVVAQAGDVAIDPLARDVARAQAAATLFGHTAAVTVGRYRLIERVGSGGMGTVWSALDPELGRPVALKLASSGSDAARARARTEGRALAKLSHPHVVPIYDVVDAEQGVFLVMELVRGETLRGFAASRPGPRAIIAAYREAALGLAAAHQANLIHRDFKPDNAVVGADHRVRVLDFGLAHDDDGDGDAAIAGTPRYMAPEQRAGMVSPAIDQYALCASLREALAAAPPRWLAPILARGAAAEPSARFPSMTALAAALGRDPRAVWRRRGVAALAIAAIGVGVAVGRGPAAAAQPSCDGGATVIAASWDHGRAARVAHLASLTGSYAPLAQADLIARLDDYARRWQLAHRGSCQAHVRGDLSTALFDRRVACLARGRTALATVGRLADDVTADQLPKLIEAAAALPALARCGDDDALAAAVAPPPTAAIDRVAAVDLQLAELAVLRDSGRVDAARALAATAVAAADELGYQPLLARAYLARGRIALAGLSGDRGAPDFAVATHAALAGGDDATAVEAFARHAFAAATGTGPERTVDGRSLIEPIAASLDRRNAFAVGLLESNLGSVALATGDRAAARSRYERAAAIADQVTGPDWIELSRTAVLGQLMLLEDREARRVGGAVLIARLTTLLGRDHPLTLSPRIVLALLEPDDASVRAALAPPCEALAHHHARLGGLYASCASDLAMLAAIAGEADQVRTWARVAITAGDHDARPFYAARGRAFLLLADGKPAEALVGFRAVRTSFAIGPTSPWFEVAYALDSAIAATLAAIAAGDAAAARAELGIAGELLARSASSMSPASAARRTRIVTELRSRHR